jgi:hypothetical protein
MFGSDSRRTSYPPDGPPVSTDDYRKNVRSETAIFTGVGCTALVDALGTQLLAQSLVSADHALGIILAERYRFARTSRLPADHVRRGLRETNLFVGTRLPNEQTGSQDLSLLAYSSGRGAVEIYGPGTAHPLLPIDDTSDEGRVMWGAATECLTLCRLCGAADDVDQSLAYNAATMAEIVTHFGSVFPTIGGACVVTVLMIDGSTREFQMPPR